MPPDRIGLHPGEHALPGLSGAEVGAEAGSAEPEAGADRSAPAAAEDTAAAEAALAALQRRIEAAPRTK
ncbi:MAG: hypothetical protein KDC98_22170, partial [Planctomycetes bacterium]|nr:hypothetical protein [Planctomycetota bacterium]